MTSKLIGRLPLRIVLMILFVLVIIAAVGPTSYMAFRNGQKAVEELAGHLQGEVVARIEHYLHDYLNPPHLINQLNLDDIELQRLNVDHMEDLARHFRSRLQRFDSVMSIAYADENRRYAGVSRVGSPGVIRTKHLFETISDSSTNHVMQKYRVDDQGRRMELTWTSQPDYDPRPRPWYQAAVQAHAKTWSPIFMWSSGAVGLDAVVPVYGNEGALLGVLDTSLTLEGIGDFLNSVRDAKTGQIFIVERSGLLIASSTIKEPYYRLDDQLQRYSVFDIHEPSIKTASTKLRQLFGDLRNIRAARKFDFDLNGQPQLAQVLPYRDSYGLDWLIVLSIPEAVFSEQITAGNRNTLMLITLYLFVSIYIARMLSHWVTKPICMLNDSAKAVTQGDLTQRVVMDRRDEVGDLSRSFNHMIEQLQTTFISLRNENIERVQAETSLRESEARYRLLAENAGDIIFTIDLNLRLTYISPSVTRIRGYTVEEALAQTIEESLTLKSRDIVKKILEEELRTEKEKPNDLWRGRTIELEVYCKNGNTVWTETSVSPLRDAGDVLTGFLGITRDISERKKAEKEKTRLEMQLAQAQKMESIGTLAGGIAHDFNNILSIIIGNSELAMGTDPVSDPEMVKQQIHEVIKAGNRAKDLVGQILAFSRKTEIMYAPIVLRIVIQESIKMLRSLLPKTIRIRQNLDTDGSVLSDPTHIHQIMINLCTNAAHAMEQTGGILDVGLKKVMMDEGGRSDELKLRPGPYLQLTVRDTGVGMPQEVLERIFEPYYTTKDIGRGTGLGLSVVHGIIKNHGGAITCLSKHGEGSAFTVYLPEIEPRNSTKNIDDTGALPPDSERILFVDDEAEIVKFVEKLLVNIGYKVVATTSSSAALDLFREQPDQFDLVITDMTMPEMAGDVLAGALMEIRANIPIILCTGYSERISEEAARKMGVREFVLKPLTGKKLTGIIRKVLDDSRHL